MATSKNYIAYGLIPKDTSTSNSTKSTLYVSFGLTAEEYNPTVVTSNAILRKTLLNPKQIGNSLFNGGISNGGF